MKCGDRGFLNLAGRPCGQTIGARTTACIFHDPNRPGAAHSAQVKGAIASRMRRALPVSTPEPPFDTIENIIAWSQRMARTALTEDVDLRRLAEARGFAQLALSALGARTQQQLVEALLSLEHGGTAVALLAQFTSAQAVNKRTPIPSRLTVVPPPGAGPA